MLIYVSRFLSGDLPSFWPHAILLGASVLASITVGIGIIFDKPTHSKAAQRVAFWCIIVGIAIEAVCTILLFVFDEAKMSQYLEARTLSNEQKQKIAEVTHKFPSRTFVTVATPENEPWGFAMDIAAALSAGGWNWAACADSEGHALRPRPPDPRPSSCQSILDNVEIDTPPEQSDVARALGDAITDPGTIGMDHVGYVIDNKIPALEIMVGAKREQSAAPPIRRRYPKAPWSDSP